MRGVHPGDPWPMGSSVTRRGVNFALFSANAHAVELCLFDESNRETRIPVKHRTADIWHVHVDGAVAGQRYGYRVHGPFDPAAGHRFNPNLLLLDPYARALTGIPACGPGQFDYVPGETELVPSPTDNAATAAKAMVVADARNTIMPKRRTSWPETILYELHVKGFTRLHEALSEQDRGRFAGLADDQVISYLKALGVTTLELLPLQEFVDEPFLRERGLSNYWGYNPIGYFAPTRRYALADPIAEFRAMVQRLHDANLEVVLDVVYNHTAEAGRLGPTFSMRGIDNASYYRLEASDRQNYVNDAGCGNSLNTAHPMVLRLVLDSLRYWVSDMGVDGFRFDLATSLGRGPEGFSSQAALFQAILQDPVLCRVKMIAEPWDLGPGGYQFGKFPNGFSEWNDRYRDTVRQFWGGDVSVLPEFARQLHGSSDVLEDAGRPPQASINFVTSHDGFTLHDLVSYETNHNSANGEENRDGHDANHSFNCGVEGPTDDPGVLALRDRQARNLVLTLLLSQGVPMLQAGDELKRTQRGNNNGYCQDNEISYLDWSRLLDEDVRAFHTFVARAIALRKSLPEVRAERFIHGSAYRHHEGIDEIEWYHGKGARMTDADWHDPDLEALGLMLHGAEIFRGLERRTNLVLVFFNMRDRDVSATMPDVPIDGSWHLVISSADDGAAQEAPHTPGKSLTLMARSVSVFLFAMEAEP